MISRTKYRADEATVAKLFESAGISGAADIAPLGAGEYNAVYRAKAGGKEYAIKIAPRDCARVLTYEKDMMASEVYWYSLMRAHTPIRVPEIHRADFEKTLIPASWFIMEKLEGKQLDQMELTEEERVEANAQMARMAAMMHKIKNDRFGYIQNGLYDDWHQAIRAMTAALVKDAAAKGMGTRRGKKLLRLIDEHRDALKKAECRMVNFDIWPTNIICRREADGIQYAWIDPERCFWGDPVADFVCLEVMAPLAEKKVSLAAYNSIADRPVEANAQEGVRYAIALAYLALIMEVEKYYRYTPFHFGWWRNVAACARFYKAAFSML